MIAPLTPGQRLGPYVVEAVIGRGGMGVVYRARDERLGRAVALKTLAAAGDARLRERLAREARAAAAVQHEHVVRLWTVGEVGGLTVLVQDYVAGGSLEDRLRASGPLPWREAARLGAQIARGLDAIHAAGLIHRDLKPANVLLDERGSARITDFGLARQVDGAAEALTRTGELLGTLAYLAPEQAGDAARVGPAADLYALGGTLVALLTGQPPFDGHGAALIAKHLTATPRAPSAVAPDVPAALDALVLRLLRKEPAERPGSAEAVARELDALVTAPAATPRRALSVALAAGVALAAALAVGLAAALPRAPAIVDEVPATPPPPSTPPPAPPEADAPDEALRRRFPSTNRLQLRRVLGDLALKVPGEPLAVAATGDGRAVAVTRGALHAFDLDTGRELAVIDAPGVVAATPLPGGRLATATASEVLVWDLERLEVVRRHPTGDAAALDRLVASRDGARLLLGGKAPAVLDLERAATLATLEGSDRYTCATLAPDGAAVFVGSVGGRVFAWDLAGPAKVIAAIGPPVTALATTGDGRWLLVGLGSGRLLVLDPRSGRVAAEHAAGGPVARLVASPDGRAVVSSGGGGTRLLAVSADGAVSAGPELAGHASPIAGAAFSPDGARVLTVGDRAVRLFDASTGALVTGPRGHAGPVLRLAPAADGRLLATGGADGSLRLWDLAAGDEREVVRAHGTPLQALAWAPDGAALLTAGHDEVSLWDAPRGEAPRRRARVTPLQDEGETRVTCAALAGEGGVVVGTNRWVRLWDPTAERTELMPLLHDAHIRSAVALGGRDVLTGLTNGWLMRLQVGPDALLTGPRQEKAPLEAHLAELARLSPTDARLGRVMTEVAASRRGGLLCGVLWDGRLVLWRADRGEVTTSREGQGAFVRGLAIEPRERLVASACDDGAVRLWSPDGALLDTLWLRAGEGPCGLAFSLDGERLLVGTTRGVVLELEVDPDR